MSWQLPSLFLLLLAYAGAAYAGNDPGPGAVVNAAAKEFDQIVYKGVVGNVLDGVPMDPSSRVSLQRANAVISNTLSGRSLAALAGLSNPVLLLGGFVWGMWAASSIKPEEHAIETVFAPDRSGGAIEQNRLTPPAVAAAPAAHAPESAAALRAIPAARTDEPSPVRPPVVKIWLSQRSGHFTGSGGN